MSSTMILVLIISSVLLESNTVLSVQVNFFRPIIEQCNKTFIISRETLFMEDVGKLENVMRTDRNGKCFVHCFLQKLDLVDPKGIIRKQGLFDSIANVLQKFPDHKNHYPLSSEFQNVANGLIVSCENSDAVKLEADPCEKLFKFFVCYKNIK